MMEINYILADPTGNMTLLVEGDVPPHRRADVASRLMEAEPTAEQAGFLSPGDEKSHIRLDMAGGEFCGNATMSAAAVYAACCGLNCGESCTVSVSVSGAAEPVSVEIRALDEGFAGVVDMPAPLSVSECALPLEGGEITLPVVRFPGISHVIVPDGMDEELAQRAVKDWCAYLKADGLGLMLLDEAAGRLRPLVYVPAVDTLFWESSCASGTTAVGAWLSTRCGGKIELKLTQPGGELSISADVTGEKPHLRLGGQLRLGNIHTLYLN
jgi:diaminopimelate epimerase